MKLNIIFVGNLVLNCVVIVSEFIVWNDNKFYDYDWKLNMD